LRSRSASAGSLAGRIGRFKQADRSEIQNDRP
jgi:hypothetical protein